MVKEDWSICPKCSFPALYSHFTSHLESDQTCPMCDKPLDPTEITRTAEKDIKLLEPTNDETP